jgi:mevalonate kinase
MKLKIPGKIFIAGEYAALKGLPALTVAVNPGFEFEASFSQGSTEFHPDSPAGLLNKEVKGHFHDPYLGLGGMGRSTAEFLAVASCSSQNMKEKWKVWNTYRRILSQGPNRPSGVDLLTQLTGGYCLTETSNNSVRELKWPFKKLDWVALITGQKIKTHEHLAKHLSLDWKLLQGLNQNVISAFTRGDEERFISALNLWRMFLFDCNMEASSTTELVDHFLDIQGVKSAKGCGAMGSDVVFILFNSNDSIQLEKSLQRWEPQQIIRSSQVCIEGFSVLSENENISTL